MPVNNIYARIGPQQIRVKFIPWKQNCEIMGSILENRRVVNPLGHSRKYHDGYDLWLFPSISYIFTSHISHHQKSYWTSSDGSGGLGASAAGVPPVRLLRPGFVIGGNSQHWSNGWIWTFFRWCLKIIKWQFSKCGIAHTHTCQFQWLANGFRTAIFFGQTQMLRLIETCTTKNHRCIYAGKLCGWWKKIRSCGEILWFGPTANSMGGSFTSKSCWHGLTWNIHHLRHCPNFLKSMQIPFGMNDHSHMKGKCAFVWKLP